MELIPEVSEEIEVMKSIYGSDFSELPPVWGCPSFSIFCKPSTSSATDRIIVAATIQFTLAKSYPKAMPKIDVIKTEGLNAKEIEVLKQYLQNIGKDLVGRVMCFDLITACCEHLSTYNKKTETLFQKMVSREQREQAALLQLKDQKEIPQESEIKIGAQAAEPVKLDSKIKDLKPTDTETNNQRDLKSTQATEQTSLAPNWLKSMERQPYNGDSDIEEGGSGDDESDKEDGQDAAAGDGIATDLQQKSRYLQEFVEINLLGHGASGEVWSCRNKLDRRIYAVKKIKLNPRESELNNKIRREVTTISRLLHKNIVRYYAAWLEERVVERSKKIDKKDKKRQDEFDFDEDDNEDSDDDDDEEDEGDEVDGTSSSSSCMIKSWADGSLRSHERVSLFMRGNSSSDSEDSEGDGEEEDDEEEEDESDSGDGSDEEGSRDDSEDEGSDNEDEDGSSSSSSSGEEDCGISPRGASSFFFQPVYKNKKDKNKLDSSSSSTGEHRARGKGKGKSANKTDGKSKKKRDIAEGARRIRSL